MQSGQVRCLLKYQDISAQKMRPLLRKLQGKNAESALIELQFLSQRTKAARVALKALSSAVANAENNNNLDIYSLKISSAIANESYTLKRMRARAKGRGARILKRRCHVQIVLNEEEN